MSLVKFIKQSKANVQAINDIMAGDHEEGSQPWWDARVELLQGWFRANPLNLGVPSDGASNFIKEQIERGNKYEKARVKIWRQIALELVEIPDFTKHITEEIRLSVQPAEDLKSSIQKAGELGVKQAALPTPQQRTPRSSDIDFLPLALNSCLSRGPSPTLPLNRLALDDIDQRLRGASRSPPGFVGIGALRGQEEAARQYLSRRDEDDDDAGFDNARRRKTVDYYEEEEEEEGVLVINTEGVTGGGNEKTAASYIERQQQWLAQKQNRLHNQRREQEAALQSEMTFAPDVGDSRRTYGLKSQIAPLSARRASAAPGATKEELEAMVAGAIAPRKTPDGGAGETGQTGGGPRRVSAAEALANKRRGSMDTAASAKSDAPARRRSSISQQKLAKLATPGTKAEDKGTGVKRRGSITKKDRKSISGEEELLGEEEKQRRRSLSPAPRGPNLSDLPADMRRSRSLTDFDDALGGGGEGKGDGDDEREEDDRKPLSEQASSSIDQGSNDADVDGGLSGPNGGSSNREASYRKDHPDSPYIFDVYSDDYTPGEFFSLVSQGRGHVRIRNGADFQMRSMYRKKDKFQRVAGVSLLVGRLERPPHDEKVITIMFDIESWTEPQAWEWWKENKRRFIDDDYRKQCEKTAGVGGGLGHATGVPAS